MNYGNRRSEEAAASVGLPAGRMISGSKTGYLRAHPYNVAMFNSTVADDDGEGLWRGDLDLTTDEPALQALARELGMNLHVLFEGETYPFRRALEGGLDVRRAAITVTAAGDTLIGKHELRWLTRDEAGRLVWTPSE